MRIDSVKVVSFSGIDGAGKSTQIDALCRYLADSGFQYSLLTFWDDIVVLKRFREQMSLMAFKGDKGIGSPEKPITRRDKNVTSWYLTGLRLVLYMLDALHLRWVLSRNKQRGSDFLIFDRYIYDELANLPLQRATVRLYLRLLKKLVPKPDIALIIDADPEAATVRKPEYPLEFVRRNREAYLQVSRIFGGMFIIPPLPIEQASGMIKRIISDSLRTVEAGQVAFRMDFQPLNFPLPLIRTAAATSSRQKTSNLCGSRMGVE
jgi:thymidylate kinase